MAAGFFALVLAVLLPWYVYPQLARLPINPQVLQLQNADGATVLVPDLKAKAGARVIRGAQVRISTYLAAPAVGSFGDSVVWMIATRVEVVGHGLLQARVERVSLDPHSSRPTNCCGDSLVTDQSQPNGVPLVHSGYITLPFNVQRRDYPVWDITLRRSRTAVFAGTERRRGFRVYKFVASNSWQPTGTQDLPGSLFGLSAPSVKAIGEYADTRTIWVDPSSSAAVDLIEQVDQRYRYGDRTVTAMSAHLVSPPLTAAQRSQIHQAALVLPWLRGRASILLVLLALVLFSVVTVRLRRLPSTGPGTAVERRRTFPEHRPRGNT